MNPKPPDSRLRRTRLPRIRRPEDLIQLLQRATLRLYKKPINHSALPEIPEDKEDVEPSADTLQRDGRHESINEASRAARELEHAHALGALHVIADLAGIDGLHGGEAEGEHAAEHVDEEDGENGHGFVVKGVVRVPRAGAGDDG